MHGAADSAGVVDVQTHFLEFGPWGDGFPQASCGEADWADCFSVEYWYDLVLGGSDTSVAVISAVPVVGEADPLSVAAMERGREGDAPVRRRPSPDPGPCRSRCRADRAAVAAMADVAAAHELCAWKVYTHSPNGWFLDDHDPALPQVGAPFIHAVRDTGVGIISVHKGLAGGNPYASPVDIGPAAAANPDIRFLVYHSGYDTGNDRGPYNPDGTGVDRLVRSVTEAGIGPAATCTPSWVDVADRDGRPRRRRPRPRQAARGVRPRAILWGTDSIWYGSPQDQIDAFRAFEITPAVPGAVRLPGADPEVKHGSWRPTPLNCSGSRVPAPACEPVAGSAGIRPSNRTSGRWPAVT